MEVRCDKCGARYRVDDSRIGPQGLPMRCGKCQNVFRVMRGQPSEAAKPVETPRPAAAPAPSDDAAGSTMMFVAPKVSAPPAPPAKPPAPAAAKPAAPKPPAPARPAAAPADADEGAGRTMMFQTAPKTSPGAKVPKPAVAQPAGDDSTATLINAKPVAKSRLDAEPPAPKPPKPAQDEGAGSTMVFGQAPVAAQALLAKPPAAKAEPPKAEAPKSKDDSAGATLMFNNAPMPKKPKTPATAVRPPIAEEPPPEEETPAAAASEEAPPEAEEPQAEAQEEPPAEEPAMPLTTQETPADQYQPEPVAEEEEPPAPAPGTFDKAPPKGLLIGVGAGLALLLVAAAGLVVWKKMSLHPPPPAALEALAEAQSSADKDTLAALNAAENKAREALDDAGPKSRFPDGAAAFARIEIQLADALADEAQIYGDKSGRETDDKKKSDDDAKVTELGSQAKQKLKAAFEALTPALKLEPKSPALHLAVADYYRANHAGPGMNKELKIAQQAKADDAQLALVQGLALLGEDDGAEKAVARLKAALAADPKSARIHFRLAQAYLVLKDEASARTELAETLKISPQHDRAKAALDGLGAAAAPAPAAAPEQK